jgi:hypothetical protein
MTLTSEIQQKIERFVSGADTSIEAANGIEVALDDAFPNDGYVQQTVEMLAMYRPEGGDFLFRGPAITQRLIETLEHLKKSS